jgi:ribonuclease T
MATGRLVNEPIERAAQLPLARRFRNFLPVVVDVETGGLNAARDALLEIAAVFIEIGPDGTLSRGETHSFHVKPFVGSNIEPASLAVTGIDPFHPLRPAIDEKDALNRIFKEVREAVKRHGCKRAILVGHNASFDLGFLNAAVARADIKRNPFHPFSTFDTVTLAGTADIFCKVCNFCLPSFFEAEAKARALGWHDDLPATLGIDPTSPVADENTP